MASSKASKLRLSVAPDRGLTIEQVYAMSAPPKAHNAHHGDVVALLPLDAEACLAEGVDPHDLCERQLEDFKEPGLDPQIVRMRFETYAGLRQSKMEGLKRAKVAIQDHAMTLIPAAGSPGKEGGRREGGEPGSLVLAQGGSSSGGALGAPTATALAMMEAEARRLEKVQQRQQRELAQMIATEMRLAAMADEQKEREVAETERKAGAEKERKERARAEAEERRVRELKKKLLGEAEEKRRREMLAVLQSKDMSVKEMLAAKRGGAEDSVEKEEMLRRRMEQKEAETEEKRRAQEEELAEKQEEMARLEEVRHARAAKVAEEKARAEEERLRALEARKAANKLAFEEAERAKKLAALERDRQIEERRAEREAKLAADRASKAQESYLEAQRRALLVAEQSRAEATRLALQETREAAERETLRRLDDQRTRQDVLRKEKHRLEELAKADAIERARAREEYKRELSLREVQAKMERAQTLQLTKGETVKKKKELTIRAKQQRELVMAAMETAKATRNWKGAQDTLQLVLAKGTSDMARAAGLSPTQFAAHRAASSSGRASRDGGGGHGGSQTGGAGALAAHPLSGGPGGAQPPLGYPMGMGPAGGYGFPPPGMMLMQGGGPMPDLGGFPGVQWQQQTTQQQGMYGGQQMGGGAYYGQLPPGLYPAPAGMNGGGAGAYYTYVQQGQG